MTDNALRFVIALLVFAGFFGLLGFMFYILPPEKLESLANNVQSQLVPLLTLVLGWYFGSSAGSAAKDKAISDLSAKS